MLALHIEQLALAFYENDHVKFIQVCLLPVPYPQSVLFGDSFFDRNALGFHYVSINLTIPFSTRRFNVVFLIDYLSVLAPKLSPPPKKTVDSFFSYMHLG